MNDQPDFVHGAWGRRSASVGGSEPFETQHVIWLQAGTCYADLRVPFTSPAATRCFTGRSGWEGKRYRWTHHLDLESVAGVAPDCADDVGDLSVEDGALIERGDFPTAEGPVPYEEAWVRLPGGCGPYLAMESPTAVLVQVGEHAITVVDARAGGGTFVAVYRTLGAAGWSAVATIGGEAEALPGPEDPPDWAVVHRGTAAASV